MNSSSRLSGYGRQRRSFSNPLSSGLIEIFNLAKLTSEFYSTDEADTPLCSIGGAAQSSIVRSERKQDLTWTTQHVGLELVMSWEQRDGSRETYQLRDSGIVRRSNSTGKASCIGLLKSVDTNGDEIEEGCSIGRTLTMAERRLESD